MHTKVVISCLLLGVVAVLSAPPPQYQHEYSTPPQYQFEYSASDEYAGLDFGQQEERDGYETSGSYRVLLPDGRVQAVSYTVIGDRGFEADVSYEGEATVYSAPASEHRPKPAYHPAPVYRPTPVYHHAPTYGNRLYGGARARTYNLQSATEAPLAAAEETPAVEEAEEEEAAEEVIEETEEAAEETVEETEAAEETGEEEEAEVEAATSSETEGASYQEEAE